MTQPRHKYAVQEFCPICDNPITRDNPYAPCCSQTHLAEHNKFRDTGYLPSPLVGRDVSIKLFAKFVNHQYAAWVALFELITGFKPPKLKEILARMSGH